MTDNEIIQTIKIPAGIESKVDGHKISIKTKNGEITRDFKSHRLNFEKQGNSIIIVGTPINKSTRALLHTYAAHIKNMVRGLEFGFKYEMQITYSHFPMTAEVKNNEFIIKNFLGEKFPRTAKIVPGAKVEIKGQNITISGHDLEIVSQTAANIEQKTKVRGKDIRRFTDGIYISNKGTIDEVPETFDLQVIRGRE
ncbi:MAG: 50S ribosomal protein L6 [archaeon]|jgi:large subunit ribosomal protein L6